MLEERAKYLALETMVDEFVEGNYNGEEMEIFVMQVLHDKLMIGWGRAESLAKKFVEELWLDADDLAQREQQATDDYFDALNSAIRGCYARA